LRIGTHLGDLIQEKASALGCANEADMFGRCPLNAPRLYPNNSLSINSLGIAAQ